MRTVPAQKTIIALGEIFSRNVLPRSITAGMGYQGQSRLITALSSLPKSSLTTWRENDIDHRRSTPLWPQVNGEVEQQNRNLLKATKIVKVEGQWLQKALNTYLMAYCMTPHTTTGVSPAQLLFGRPVRCKVPELEEVRGTDLKVQDKDSKLKQKSKDYANIRRNAKENDIQVRDKVLIQQPKSNKLTTRFEAELYRVVD